MNFSEVCFSVVVVPASHIYILCFADTIRFEYICKTAQTAVLLAYYKLSSLMAYKQYRHWCVDKNLVIGNYPPVILKMASNSQAH